MQDNAENIIFDKSTPIDINNEYPLNNKWTLWFHELNDKKWDTKSYRKKCEFNTLNDFIIYYEKKNLIKNGFFFIMKENIFPRWEEPENVNGGSWTFKIDRRKVTETWYFLSMALIGNTICNKYEDTNDINGLSITIKDFNCIIKIWNKTSSKNSLNILKQNIINLDYKGFRYKKYS